MKTVQVMSERDYEALGYLGRQGGPEPIVSCGWPLIGWRGTFADALRIAPSIEVLDERSWPVVLTRCEWLDADEYFTLARLLARSVMDLWSATAPAIPFAVKAWLKTGDDGTFLNSARADLRHLDDARGKDFMPSDAVQVICAVVYGRWQWIMRARQGCAFWYPGSTLYTACVIASGLWVQYPPAPMMWTIRAPGFAEVQRRLLSFIDDGALAPAQISDQKGVA